VSKATSPVCSIVAKLFFYATYFELLIGQGVKVCPMSDLASIKVIHICASREDIKKQLGRDRQQKLDLASPTRDVFEKTLALISALQKNGCPGPLYEPTFMSPEEEVICCIQMMGFLIFGGQIF